MRQYFVLLAILLLPYLAVAQNTATIVGTLSGKDNEAVTEASVSIEGTAIATYTDAQGNYALAVPAGRKIVVIYSNVAYQQVRKVLTLQKGETIKIDIEMADLEVEGVVITDNITRTEIGALVISPKDIEKYPTTTGSLEQVLQYLAPGVSAGPGGELTSQYSVRGGNYDENLVYVNGFEIYRPFLVRTGQQEGLSFPNANMTKAFTFSTGGFSSQYGDKLSSVLDIRYKRPKQTEVSVEGSLLGANAYIGGAILKKKERGLKLSNPERLTYMIGARYKTTRGLLSSLDVKGEYIPNFVDLQADITYDISRQWQLELIGNYNYSAFSIVPAERSTTTGLFNYALQLSAVFSGKEKDDFTTKMGGIGLTYRPRENLNMRWQASAFQTNENERRDVTAQYAIYQVETSLGSSNAGEVVGTLGVGEQQQYYRNYLQANVANIGYQGSWEVKTERPYMEHQPKGQNDKTRRKPKTRQFTHFVQWGARWQYEKINDQLNEWERQDSLGYTVPYQIFLDSIHPTYQNLTFNNVIKAKNNLTQQRATAYLQDTWTISDEQKEIRVNLGMRAGWSDLNGEAYVTPRLQLFYSPRLSADSTRRLHGVTYKLATGLYYQPPFYRELRNFQGQVNRSMLAQKSVHVVGGVALDFTMLKRPFKFLVEAYYKYLWDVVPFDIDNVRVRYYGANMAKANVTGIDLRLNGELVKDAESWVNLSFLRARESFDSVTHYRNSLVAGYDGLVDSLVSFPVKSVPRATDQAMILSMYFQDYLPQAKWCSVNLALTVGTGLPFGVPFNNEKFRNGFRFNPYHRVDIGFSFSLWNRERYDANPNKKPVPKFISKNFRNLWLSVEVFNLLQVSNASGNTWIKDFSNTYFAIPNYLTSRRANIRLRADF